MRCWALVLCQKTEEIKTKLPKIFHKEGQVIISTTKFTSSFVKLLPTNMLAYLSIKNGLEEYNKKVKFWRTAAYQMFIAFLI